MEKEKTKFTLIDWLLLIGSPLVVFLFGAGLLSYLVEGSLTQSVLPLLVVVAGGWVFVTKIKKLRQ